MSTNFLLRDGLVSLTIDGNKTVVFHDSGFSSTCNAYDYGKDINLLKCHTEETRKRILIATVATQFGADAYKFIRAGRAGNTNVLKFLKQVAMGHNFNLEFATEDFKCDNVVDGAIFDTAKYDIVLGVKQADKVYAEVGVNGEGVDVFTDVLGIPVISTFLINPKDVIGKDSLRTYNFMLWLALCFSGVLLYDDVEVRDTDLMRIDAQNYVPITAYNQLFAICM